MNTYRKKSFIHSSQSVSQSYHSFIRLEFVGEKEEIQMFALQKGIKIHKKLLTKQQ